MTLRRIASVLILWLAIIAVVNGDPSPEANAARLVAWKPKAGMTRDFEMGYQRHLEWHRAHDDPWAWHGWSIVTGPRTGYFVDGTFFHRWTDFDSPVAPQQDAADNAVNVVTYADLQGVAAYERIPALSRADAAQLSAPLLTFAYIDVAPGRGKDLESALAASERTRASGTGFLLLRPIAGTSEYLLMLPARAQSDLAEHAKLVDELLAPAAKQPASSPLVRSVRLETGRYRPDLSYLPTDQ